MLSIIALAALCTLPMVAYGDTAEDNSRLGEFYTAIPLYRSGAGSNVISVGLGTPAQQLNLTASTNFEFTLVTAEDCGRCTEDANDFEASESSSLTPTRQALSYTAIYPSGSLDTLLFQGVLVEDLITDGRGDTNNARPFATISSIRQNAASAAGGTETTLSAGSSGFWGMGIYNASPERSLIPDMLSRTNDGAPNNLTYFTVGFNVDLYDRTPGRQAGTIHWGGAPVEAYQGNFNWLNVNTTVAGGWGVGVDRIRMGDTVVDIPALYGSLDPGFDEIYVPSRVAEKLYSTVPSARRDQQDASRWNLPCNTNISMSITISGYEYKVAASELVQGRDIARQTCWGSVVAWQNGSLPDTTGEIRMGTPFLSGVYSVLYYSPNQRLVGIAGKPNSVNALNVNQDSGGGKPNTKLAGILIGVLLTVLVIFFVGCYSRNRNTMQSIWYRAVRRQHRFATNAMVRSATMPHPMAIPPPTIPLMNPGMMPFPRPMMGMQPPMGPMGPMGHPASMGYMGQMGGMNNMMWAPPPYQPPIQPQPMPQQQQQQQQTTQMPAQTSQLQQNQSQPQQIDGQQPGHMPSQHTMPTAVHHQPQGIYSPRQQPGSAFSRVLPSMFRSSPRGQHQYMAPPDQSHLYGGHHQQDQHNHPAHMPIPDMSQTRDLQHHQAVQKSHQEGRQTQSPPPQFQPAFNPEPQGGKVGRPGAHGVEPPAGAYDQWLRKYSGAGQQDQQRYPEHRQTQYKIQTTGPYRQSAPSDKEKSRSWNWARKPRSGYGSVVQSDNPEHQVIEHPYQQQQLSSPGGRGSRMKGWIPGSQKHGLSPNSALAVAERAREREAMARSGLAT